MCVRLWACTANMSAALTSCCCKCDCSDIGINGRLKHAQGLVHAVLLFLCACLSVPVGAFYVLSSSFCVPVCLRLHASLKLATCGPPLFVCLPV